MNLQENIQRIKEVMLVNEESKKELTRQFKFSDYEETMDFVNKVAKVARKQNHHPDITFGYDTVRVSITDHEKGGVSEKCHKFMKEVDKIK